MNHLRAFLDDWVTVFNLVVLSYFFLGNGIYTILMLLSLRATWVHIRQMTYQGLDALCHCPLTPPVTIIIPAWNEQNVIVNSVRSALQADYPDLQVIVVDDGSTDTTVERLVQSFALVEMDGAYHPSIPTAPIRTYHINPAIPNLLVVSKVRGGKPDALNAGINLCRSPYFCNLDADCLLEPDALLRLMDPVVNSAVETVVSGGIVRILNGCETKNGRVVRVGLPQTWLERFQVVEYLRSFLFGRTGWHLLGGTLIVSGAFAVFHRATVIDAGGFCHDTVTEDMDLIVQLHQWAAENHRKIRMSFTSDPVCWTECPSTLAMLAKQRRRWQLGLCQTLWKHSEILFGRKYGIVGWLSFPFHSYVEGLGAAVEFLGYLLIPLGIFLGMVPPALLLMFILLGFIYGGFLSVGAVLLEELTYRRYPRFRDLLILLIFAMFENIGYRQMVLYYRFQGVLKFLAGSRRWEKVAHVGATAEETGV
jgi:cellulose synthase/poly-beta-1,6-N-acetylglucosamine synthase-like glycosyltransferase